MGPDVDDLGKLVDAVLEAPKYRNIHADVVRNVGRRELESRRSLKEAVKATKNKLHQVGGAYLDTDLHYAQWLSRMQSAAESRDRAELRRTCIEVMAHHSSTRERLQVLDRFFAETLSGLSRIRSVLDIACGFNPLAIPWMPLSEDVSYYAYDMYVDMAAFLNSFMCICKVQGQALACDVAHDLPTHQADLALVLKSLPCLERLDKAAGRRLIDRLKADHVLISFPVRSLGGRDKGMVQSYQERFLSLVADRPWRIQRFVFPTELAFLVSKCSQPRPAMRLGHQSMCAGAADDEDITGGRRASNPARG